MKIAFLFSGQGAQDAGMGKELFENFEICKEVFKQADDSLGFKISDICFNKNEDLDKTEFTQPAILTTSIAIFKLAIQKGIKPDYLAGLSLGEYSALVASGALDFSQTVKLVKKRGKFMTEAVPIGVGAMSAVLNLAPILIEEACKEASDSNFKAMIANYNTYGQVVIAGHLQAVEKAEKLIMEKGAKRVIRLNVSGPFHTDLLKPASEKLSQELKNITINETKIPVITNLTANFIENIEDTLTKQVMSPVLWEQTIEKLIDQGVDTFIEIGPGKTLISFVKKINKDVFTYNIEDLTSFEKTCKGVGL